MKFKYSILYVENVKATMDFFCKAFGLKIKFIHESGDFGELETGNTTLAFSSISLMNKLDKYPGKPNPKSPVFEIAFETDDVASALKTAVQAGATIIQDVKEEAWGQTTSYVCDPNGYIIEICSPVKL
ncbi:MAG: VOC family protein [Alphaproteobacteria bacterium]